MNTPDSELLASLRADTLSVLREAIGDSTDVALIDAPNQRNVGDSLIWAGEMAYFDKLGLRLRYVADLRSFDPAALRRVMPEGVVLLHGGGNLGDLWLGHQVLREEVSEALLDYRVVQLPQSIHFGDRTRAQHANKAMGGHPDFHMLIRDSASMDKATDLLPDVRTVFCYDMALGWEAPEIGLAPDARVLVIARQDVEAASGLGDMDPDLVVRHGAFVTDWHVDDQHAHAWASARRTASGYSKFSRVRARYARWLPVGFPERVGAGAVERINRINIDVATDLYAASSGVVTDRLHAHVLAALLNRPHVVLDNNYGKVSTIYNDYTGRFSTANYATNVDEAWEKYSSLVGV